MNLKGQCGRYHSWKVELNWFLWIKMQRAIKTYLKPTWITAQSYKHYCAHGQKSTKPAMVQAPSKFSEMDWINVRWKTKWITLTTQKGPNKREDSTQQQFYHHSFTLLPLAFEPLGKTSPYLLRYMLPKSTAAWAAAQFLASKNPLVAEKCLESCYLKEKSLHSTTNGRTLDSRLLDVGWAEKPLPNSNQTHQMTSDEW